MTRGISEDERTRMWLASLCDDDETMTFEGASELGLPEPEGLRAVREAGERAWTIRHGIRDVLGFQEIPMHADTDPAPVAETVARGFTHLFTVRCEYPNTPGELAIPCDGEYRDGQAGTYAALYRAAWDAGWRYDKLRHWACPRHAKLSGLYQALWPVTFWDPDAIESHMRRDPDGERDAIGAAELDVIGRTRAHFDASHDRGRHARELRAS